jgi:spermidine synthase
MPSPLASLLVFLSSAAVLVLELLAARLLIPYVGNTLETYTAIIGVVLAGIALGTWLGGRAADRRDPRRLLPPLLVAGGALAAVAIPLVDAFGAGRSGSGPLTTTVVTAVTFLAPAAVLSAVTPVVIKLQLASLEETGHVVGRLSAISTLGGIAGTFLTGFVLVALFPTRATVRAVAVLLVLGGLAMALVLARGGAGRALGRLGADGTAPLLGIAPLVLAALAGGASLATDGRCEVESRYYCIAVRDHATEPGVQILVLDTLSHSAVDVDDPRRLVFTYVAWYGDVIAGTFPDGRPLRALHVGAGGLTMPRWLRVAHPGSVQIVAELDPAVVRVAVDRLGFTPGPDVEVRRADARRVAAELAADPQRRGSFDLVVGDAFGGIAVPWHLATREAAADLAALLGPEGIYVLNVIDFGPREFLRAELATLSAVFAHVAVMQRPGGPGGNHVLVASHSPLALDRIAAANRARARADELVHGAALAELVAGARPLTDDRAPVDQLLTTRG